MTLVCLGWCVVFSVFNVGCGIYAKERKIHAHMVLLSELQQAKEGASRDEGSPKKDEDEDMDEQEEEIEEFLRRQREKWKHIRENPNKHNLHHPGQTNNLSSIRESKNEGTFLESNRGGVEPYKFTVGGAGMQVNENLYS
jgi:hypothetical protein